MVEINVPEMSLRVSVRTEAPSQPQATEPFYGRHPVRWDRNALNRISPSQSVEVGYELEKEVLKDTASGDLNKGDREDTTPRGTDKP